MNVPSLRPRSAVLLALVAITAVGAGCGAFGGEDEVPSGETVEEKLDSLDAVEATVVSEVNGSVDVTESRSTVVARLHTGEQRSRVVSGGAAGTLTVSNGTTTWLYNRSADRVQVVDVAESSTSQNQTFESTVAVFERLHSESSNESTPGEISQLPVVPGSERTGGGSAPAGGSLSFYGNVSLTYNGTTAVDGRDTYEVLIEPRTNDSAIDRTRMWFDAEWYYPIKTRTALTLDGDRTVVTTTYRNVTFNPDIPEGTFEFDPPSNATVVESAYETQSFDSRASLAASTDVDVPSPDVPEGYRFDSGTLASYRGNQTLSMEYTNGSATLVVSKNVAPPENGTIDESGERVDVAGNEGRFETLLEDNAVSWRCGGSEYTIFGPQSRESLLAVAESMACE